MSNKPVNILIHMAHDQAVSLMDSAETNKKGLDVYLISPGDKHEAFEGLGNVKGYLVTCKGADGFIFYDALDTYHRPCFIPRSIMEGSERFYGKEWPMARRLLMQMSAVDEKVQKNLHEQSEFLTELYSSLTELSKSTGGLFKFKCSLEDFMEKPPQIGHCSAGTLLAVDTLNKMIAEFEARFSVLPMLRFPEEYAGDLHDAISNCIDELGREVKLNELGYHFTARWGHEGVVVNLKGERGQPVVTVIASMKEEVREIIISNGDGHEDDGEAAYMMAEVYQARVLDADAVVHEGGKCVSPSRSPLYPIYKAIEGARFTPHDDVASEGTPYIEEDGCVIYAYDTLDIEQILYRVILESKDACLPHLSAICPPFKRS